MQQNKLLMSGRGGSERRLPPLRVVVIPTIVAIFTITSLLFNRSPIPPAALHYYSIDLHYYSIDPQFPRQICDE